MLTKPNFFIIGAPKTGTSALQTYLSTHPNIFMAGPEEPNYYSTDFKNQQEVKTEDEYLQKYFKGITAKHLAVGEKSTWYLSSDTAIDNIELLYDDAKYIAILRNPVELACSLHSELLYTQQENISDFEDAWNAQPDRKKGKRMPDTLKMDEKVLFYSDVCRLGAQVERVLARVPVERVMFILQDDFICDTKAVYQSVLKFLNVPDDKRNNFPRVNQNRIVRSRLIDSMLTPNNKYLLATVKKIKEVMGVNKLGIGGILLKAKNTLNTKKTTRRLISDELTVELIDYFNEDVQLLSQLIGRDLSHWLYK